MTIILKPVHEKLLLEAINSGLAHSRDEALDQAFESLRVRLPRNPRAETESAAAARRLGTFGQRHGLSLGGLTFKELLRESRP
jgi:hypothetical protein